MMANNDSMTTMSQTLREAQRPINSTVTPRGTLVMEHMGNSKTASKQPPAVEGGCPLSGPCAPPARRDLTIVHFQSFKMAICRGQEI